MDEFCGSIHDEVVVEGRREAIVSVVVRSLAEVGVGLGPGPGLRVIGIVEVGDGREDLSERASAVAAE
jgi:hypothetical protein